MASILKQNFKQKNSLYTSSPTVVKFFVCAFYKMLSQHEYVFLNTIYSPKIKNSTAYLFAPPPLPPLRIPQLTFLHAHLSPR